MLLFDELSPSEFNRCRKEGDWKDMAGDRPHRPSTLSQTPGRAAFFCATAGAIFGLSFGLSKLDFYATAISATLLMMLFIQWSNHKDTLDLNKKLDRLLFQAKTNDRRSDEV
jgi:low affinity Fe/Cu permease